MKIENLVRKNILALKPYSSARSLYSRGDAILLDANENGEGPFGAGLNRYPDPLQRALKNRIGALKNVPPDHLFLGNGSDEAIDLLLRIFCEPGTDEILICPPTYGMYEVMANIHGCGVRKVLLDKNFQLQTEAILAARTPAVKLIFLCSPNNPTGNLLDNEAITAILRRFDGIVVVDEAYFDFAEKAASWSERLSEFPNLVVLQTLSKAWALAGVRLGMAFASPAIIELLNKVKYPYNLSQLAQQESLTALRQPAAMERSKRAILQERNQLENALRKLPFVQKIHRSDANFLLVKFDDPVTIFEKLKAAGVIVRDRSKEPLCDGCLRITVGTLDENEKLLNVLSSDTTFGRSGSAPFTALTASGGVNAANRGSLKAVLPRKALFLDRDGVLIEEPPLTFQVNTLDELVLRPGVIRNLRKIATELDFDFIMVTNQDGLGTPAYPQENFDQVQGKLLQLLENEGITFYAIHVDKSTPAENLPTRKPGTAMLTAYMNGSYDLANSFVIGDRHTDILLAKNLGAQAIALRGLFDLTDWESQTALIADHWDAIYEFLRRPPRQASVRRKTKETDISVFLNLDGKGESNIRTGIGFFDHMLDQVARHGGIDLKINALGDLHIDEHHTVEDTGLALGEAFLKALGEKRGISRYGFCLPMDDCLAQVALDFGGRPWLVWEAEFQREKIGDLPTELFSHFFKSWSDTAKCNLNIQANGSNEHHKIEAIFKAFARSLKMAVHREHHDRLPSTKGVL
jgi:imidazoleglycerol-phosphate dehydratase/histidinol-phosphatase